MERDKDLSNLLYSICEGVNSFYSSETQRKICPMVRKKPFKIWPFANDVRMKTEDGKAFSD